MSAAIRIDSKLDERLWIVSLRCIQWAGWVNSDRLPVLGYPSETSESATLYDVSKEERKRTANRWGSTDKTDKSAKIAMPDWKIELLMDRVINDINDEYRRVLYAHHQVRLKYEQMQECRIPVSRGNVTMHLLGRDGRYNWPRYRADRLALINLPSRTFDRSLNGARHAILSHPGYL